MSSPGDEVHAVIVTLFPEVAAQRDLEFEPGVVPPKYEGTQVCGHGTVIWKVAVGLPLDGTDEQGFLRWLDDPAVPLDAS